MRNRHDFLGKQLETDAMPRTDQLKVATIKREQARDVQSLRYHDDQRVYKIEFGIGILAEDLCGAQVVFLHRSFES